MENEYNTKTAKLIASDGNFFGDKSSFWEETLYQKETGEFFLCGWGSPATGGTGEGKIIPYTVQEAKEWLFEHGTANMYEEVFGSD